MKRKKESWRKECNTTLMHDRSTCLQERKEEYNYRKRKEVKRSLGYKVYPQHPDGAVWLDHGCLVASDCTVVHSISMEMDG